MNYRKQDAHERRTTTSKLAYDRPHPRHIANGDEQKFRHDFASVGSGDNKAKEGNPSYLMSFTKGLPHNEETGLINNPQDYQYLVRGIDSGDIRDFRDTPLGSKKNVNNLGCRNDMWLSEKAKTSGEDGGPVQVRGWESQSAGLAYEMEGPDPQAVTMPPHPKLGSEELTAEMAEVYAQAILRDEPFNALTAGVIKNGNVEVKENLDDLHVTVKNVEDQKELTDILQKLKWFDPTIELDLCCDVNKRRRNKSNLSPSNAYRGITTGDDIGPYLSQFLLVGNRGVNGNDAERSPADGLISYGAQTTDQRVRDAKNIDYLTKWEEWIDVQNGANFQGLEEYKDNRRKFIASPRDLATYVHYDALYQAYLNACLILLGNKTPFDPGIPFQEEDVRDHQQGFAHFGGPHILSLVTEVATRALKAVRFQKYNVHRRCRPEVLAGRLYKYDKFVNSTPEIVAMKNELKTIGILTKIENKNGTEGNYLLPMAFCEGSPMHPAYGAGHATVAGACVTILKAFFDHKHPLSVLGNVQKLSGNDQIDFDRVSKYFKNNHGKEHTSGCNVGYVPSSSGHKLNLIPILDQDCKPATLTVEGELNKLASNISIGRDWAGVHYFTDYIESLKMGEQIAIGILEEQKLTYKENFSMTIPLFDGTSYRV